MKPATQNSLPGYRGVLTTIGAAYVLLAAMNLVQGAAKVLEPFNVPDDVLKSEYFLDFYHWHFAHMDTPRYRFAMRVVNIYASKHVDYPEILLHQARRLLGLGAEACHVVATSSSSELVGGRRPSGRLAK